MVSLALGEFRESNLNNLNSFSTDKSFLAVSDNNGDYRWTTAGAPSARVIAGKTWKVNEVGSDMTNHMISVSDESSSASEHLQRETTTVYLLVDTDTDFSA